METKRKEALQIGKGHYKILGMDVFKSTKLSPRGKTVPKWEIPALKTSYGRLLDCIEYIYLVAPHLKNQRQFKLFNV